MAVCFQRQFTVNGTEIEVEVDFGVSGEEVYRFPTLYKVDKLKRTNFWRIYVIREKYYRESGIIGGAVKTYEPVTATPKNVGRSNQTSAEDQALFEAFSAWKHKKDQLYSEEVGRVNPEVLSSRLRPMLAQKFSERKKYAKYPAGVSPKLDGVRVMIYQDPTTNGVHMLSRLGKSYKFMEGIRKEAGEIIAQYPGRVVLDGELYSHTIPFNAISGAVRSANKPSKFDDLLEYYIFDLYLPDSPRATYADRIELLDKLVKRVSLGRHGLKRIHCVGYDVVQDEKEIPGKHSEYVAKGYEGLIFRNLDGLYHLGQRVDDLLKYKEFEDAEFKVVDVVEGVGSEKGAAIFVCEMKGAEGMDTFTVRPRGTIEKRRWQLQHKEKYIGKLLTVRYQPLPGGTATLPRFPVGIKFDPSTEEVVAVALRNYE